MSRLIAPDVTKDCSRDTLDFGDYCVIEQKRYGGPNEFYTYKVVGRLESNAYVNVPVDFGKEGEREVIRGGIVPVVRAICCGVAEDKVLKFRVEDVTPSKSADWHANLMLATNGDSQP